MKLFGGGPEKVVQQGDSKSGSIVAIDVSIRGDDPPTENDEYVVAIDGGQRRLAVRQVLDPDIHVRLGMPVQVKVRGDDLVIDWAATLIAAGVEGGSTSLDRWKSVKDSGQVGITDSRFDHDKLAKKGTAAEVRIDRIETKSRLGGMLRTRTIHATVTIAGDEPYEVELGNQQTPFYAAHLAVDGNVVPGFVDDKRLDRVTIDWPRAAERNPGVGVAPSPVMYPPPEEFSETIGGDIGEWSPSAPAAFEPPPPIDGVSWELYLQIDSAIRREKIKPKEWDAYAQRFGVPGGGWAKTSQAWGKQMMRNADLQMAYAATYQ